ncbi:MAG: glycosyltransferase family 4 protein [Desulfomonilia bacterium]
MWYIKTNLADTFKMIATAILTSAHDISDTRIFYKECKTLAGAGYQVTYIVPHEQDHFLNGVCIHSVPKPKNRLDRFIYTIWNVYKAAKIEDVECYHFHDPELIPIGLLLKIKGKKVIYDVHEDVPKQILNKNWIPSILRSVVSKVTGFVEHLSALFFDGIIAATPDIASNFPETKTIIVQNFPIQHELTTSHPTPYCKRSPIIAYVGGISEIRGIKEMIRAMSILKPHCGACIHIGGTFYPSNLEEEVKNLTGWAHVKYMGWLSREQISHLLNNARIGLVLLHPKKNYLLSYPIKLFEYMSVGIPVIASDFPLWREIIEGAGCGLLVNPLDPKAIADSILWLLEHPEEAEIMGKRGQEAVRHRYNWQNEEIKLLDFYSKILGNINNCI